MRKIALFAVLIMPLVACGNRVAPKKLTSTQQQENPQKGCPAPVAPSHSITLTFPVSAPAKVAVTLPGDTNFRMSECANLTPVGVRVSVSRAASNSLTLTIHDVPNASGTYELVASQSIAVFDLHNCDTTPATQFFSPAQPLPIVWSVDYPNGAACSARALGAYSGSVRVDGVSAALGDVEAAIEGAAAI